MVALSLPWRDFPEAILPLHRVPLLTMNPAPACLEVFAESVEHDCSGKVETMIMKYISVLVPLIRQPPFPRNVMCGRLIGFRGLTCQMIFPNIRSL